MRTAIYFSKLINTLTPRFINILRKYDRKNNISNLDSTGKNITLLQKCTLSAVMQDGTKTNQVVWDPFQIFNCPKKFKYAVVILNRPINWKCNILCEIWRKAQVTVTVDGGTQRWLRYLSDEGIDMLSEEHTEYVPDLITGDMDSCPPFIIEKLRNFHSLITETPDQNETDYTKALRELKLYAKSKNIEVNQIFVFAETSGRFDHLLANVNTLYKTEDLIGKMQVIQIASNSLTWLLKPGYHRIAIPEILVQLSCWCGLLPIGSPVNCITTTGLKWNLVNARMEFGGMVSTSNTYSNCSEVTIHTDSPVVWTMGIEPLKKGRRSSGIS